MQPVSMPFDMLLEPIPILKGNYMYLANTVYFLVESLDTSFAGRTTVAKPPPQTPVKPSGRSPSSLPSKTAPTRPHQRKAPGLAKLDLAAADPVQTSSKRKVDELAEKSTPKRRRSVKKKPAERPGEEVAEEAPLVPKEVGAFLTPPEKPLVGSWKCSICTSWNSQFWATCRGFVDESGKQGRCPRTKSQNAEEEKGEKDGWEKEEKHAPGEWLSRYCGTWNDKFETLCAGEGDHLPMGGASCSDPKEAACEHKIERTPLQKYCDSIHVPYLRE